VKRYKPKKNMEGKLLLNLACGIKTHPDWNNIDFSLYTKFAKHSLISKVLNAIGILSDERYKNILNIDKDIICWDLKRGIPFEDNTFDFLYCSQFIEHIYRDKLPLFIKECYRVLKSGGIIRIVTPNLEFYTYEYANVLKKIKDSFYNKLLWDEYEKIVNGIFEQIVRKESYGTSKQKLIVKYIEKIIKGDAEKAGETHKWLYDFYSLKLLLEEVGFKNIINRSPQKSYWGNFTIYSFEVNYLYESYSEGNTMRENLFVEGIK